MPIDTAKRNKRQYGWQKENADRINFLMPKGYKAVIKAAAEENGMRPSEFIRAAIDDKLENCGVDIKSACADENAAGHPQGENASGEALQNAGDTVK